MNLRPYEVLASTDTLIAIRNPTSTPNELIQLLREMQALAKSYAQSNIYEYSNGWFVELEPVRSTRNGESRYVMRDGKTYFRTSRRRADFEKRVREAWQHLGWIYDCALTDDRQFEREREKSLTFQKQREKEAMVEAWCADREEVLNVLLQAYGCLSHPALRARCWALMQKHGADAKVEVTL